MTEDSKTDLVRVLLNAEESHRRQLGKQLHDGLSQDLSSMLLICGNLKSQSGEEIAEDVKDVLAAGRRCIEELRMLSTLLAPPLEEGALVRNLAALMDSLETRTACNGSLECETPLKVQGEAALHIFRCVQELVEFYAKQGATYVHLIIRPCQEIEFKIDHGWTVQAPEIPGPMRTYLDERIRLSEGRIVFPAHSDASTVLYAPLC